MSAMKSGTHAVAVDQLRDAALHAMGWWGDDDDDPVLSCLDALADDMRVLEAAVAGAAMLIDVENAVGRFVGRVKAIRRLYVELGKQTKAVA